MGVNIKSMSVDMEVKNKGVEFEVRDTKGNFLGDFYVTKAGLVWCKGKTSKRNGVQVKWQEFISWMEAAD